MCLSPRDKQPDNRLGLARPASGASLLNVRLVPILVGQRFAWPTLRHKQLHRL